MADEEKLQSRKRRIIRHQIIAGDEESLPLKRSPFFQLFKKEDYPTIDIEECNCRVDIFVSNRGTGYRSRVQRVCHPCKRFAVMTCKICKKYSDTTSVGCCDSCRGTCERCKKHKITHFCFCYDCYRAEHTCKECGIFDREIIYCPYKKYRLCTRCRDCRTCEVCNAKYHIFTERYQYDVCEAESYQRHARASEIYQRDIKANYLKRTRYC